MKKIFLFLLLTLAHLSFASNTYSIILDYNQFGHLKQEGPTCQATSIINSFMYLRNRYPQIYGSSDLLTDYNGGGIDESDLAIDRDLLYGGWDDPVNGTKRAGTGTSDKGIWEAKTRWVEDFAPGTTQLHGMYFQDTQSWYNGGLLHDNAYPTWDFLLDQIEKGQDVELLITIVVDPGHVITLGGLEFDDDNHNGQWDAGESRYIHWLEPNNPIGGFLVRPLVKSAGGFYGFDWGDAVTGSSEMAWIDGAFAESPIIPEPATILLLGTGLAVLFLKKRFK